MSAPSPRLNRNGTRPRTLHDQTSYNTIPTARSPTNTSPSLTQSTSDNSNPTSTPSTSPPLLVTPPRTSRSRTRYPDLGRVPLHRRGTSKTYERLEDLLREAGYKETRVFTPEGERGGTNDHEAQPNADQKGGVRGSVGAMVEFLAGLMPGAAADSSSDLRRSEAGEGSLNAGAVLKPHSNPAYSPPASPLTQRQLQKQKQRTSISSDSHSPTSMASSVESLQLTPQQRHKPLSKTLTPMLPPNFVYSRSDPPQQQQQRNRPPLPHHTSEQYQARPRPSLEKEGRQASFHSYQQSLAPPSSPDRIAHPRPSRAGAYLRHMASAPNMPKRSNSALSRAPARTFLFDSDVKDDSRCADDDGNKPPLPRTWLETVARAVLFGGAGAYIGGPSDPPGLVEPRRQISQTRSLRPTRSSISQSSPRRAKYLRPPRSGLSDHTNVTGGMLAPPELFTRIERGRAGKSAGEVTRTRVVCRSAPASRNNSRVRVEDGNRGENRREQRSGYVNKRKDRGKREERKLPSLANTKTEGDSWDNKRDKVAADGANRYLSGWGVGSDSDGDGGDEGRSSSEDEGELDLARILVPPKRQNSIKSLRKHLSVNEDPNSGAAAHLMRAASGLRSSSRGVTSTSRGTRPRTGKQSAQREDWDGSEAEEWGRGWVRRAGRRSSEEEEVHTGFLTNGHGSRLGNGGNGTARSRLRLPGNWGSAGNGS